jgi:hypothetical protein
LITQIAALRDETAPPRFESGSRWAHTGATAVRNRTMTEIATAHIGLAPARCGAFFLERLNRICTVDSSRSAGFLTCGGALLFVRASIAPIEVDGVRKVKFRLLQNKKSGAPEGRSALSRLYRRIKPPGILCSRPGLPTVKTPRWTCARQLRSPQSC